MILYRVSFRRNSKSKTSVTCHWEIVILFILILPVLSKQWCTRIFSPPHIYMHSFFFFLPNFATGSESRHLRIRCELQQRRERREQTCLLLNYARVRIRLRALQHRILVQHILSRKYVYYSART